MPRHSLRSCALCRKAAFLSAHMLAGQHEIWLERGHSKAWQVWITYWGRNKWQSKSDLPDCRNNRAFLRVKRPCTPAASCMYASCAKILSLVFGMSDGASLLRCGARIDWVAHFHRMYACATPPRSRTNCRLISRGICSMAGYPAHVPWPRRSLV